MFGIIISLTASIGFGSSSVFAKISMQKMQSGTTTLISLITSTIITLFVSTLFTQTEEYNKLNTEPDMIYIPAGPMVTGNFAVEIDKGYAKSSDGEAEKIDIEN